ncbi:hypothetical protein [Bacillus sp. B-jedd]|uniref:hypothetical protein n=1 Tax=Bacillus sp. B-jedd TaxID=1476857 RepID=UPI0005155874|nr:hypothetical protein [Bacillus sp. B-jedd]CEG27192.1 hypothetical protein BN1002_02048 [Bacillus sp. B-jedd]
MKKVLGIAIALIILLSACSTSTLSFKEVDRVPKSVQENINPNYKLQSIRDGKKGSYIIFHSRGDVESKLVPQGNKVVIKFKVLNGDDNSIKRYVYYLTTESKHDVLEVLVNGKSIPFDEIRS